MFEAIAGFAAFLQLSDKYLARAEREDLEECARILAVQYAHYKAKFGELPMSDTLEVLSSETMDDKQAKWIADGFEIVEGAGYVGGGIFQALAARYRLDRDQSG